MIVFVVIRNWHDSRESYRHALQSDVVFCTTNEELAIAIAEYGERVRCDGHELHPSYKVQICPTEGNYKDIDWVDDNMLKIIEKHT